LRRERIIGARIAELTGEATAAVSRVLRMLSLDPSGPARRHEHTAAGDMLHLATKKLGRIV
jgi:hypothetical protein